MLKNKKYKLKAKKKGFSFVELIVAVFIFVLVVTTSTEVFVKMIKNYKNAREIQRDLENAQYAMNLMAKTIRTSSVLSCSGDGANFNNDCSLVSGTITAINIFDYSRSKCMIYNFDQTNKKLQYKEPTISGINLDECGIYIDWDSPQDMISGTATGGYVNNGSFFVVQSTDNPDSPSNSIVGKVTISMQVCPASGCPAGSDKAIIQTSVSLRDYTKAGI